MSVYLRGTHYYMDFVLNGERIFKSCKTDDKLLAEQLEARMYELVKSKQAKSALQQSSREVAMFYYLVKDWETRTKMLMSSGYHATNNVGFLELLNIDVVEPVAIKRECYAPGSLYVDRDGTPCGNKYAGEIFNATMLGMKKSDFMTKCHALFVDFPKLQGDPVQLPLSKELAPPPVVIPRELPPLVKEMPSVCDIYSTGDPSHRRLMPISVLEEEYLVEFNWVQKQSDNPSVRVIFALLIGGKAHIVAKRLLGVQKRGIWVNQEGKRVYPDLELQALRAIKASDLVDKFVESFCEWWSDTLPTYVGLGPNACRARAKRDNEVQPTEEETTMKTTTATTVPVYASSDVIKIKRGQKRTYHAYTTCRTLKYLPHGKVTELTVPEAEAHGLEKCGFCYGDWKGKISSTIAASKDKALTVTPERKEELYGILAKACEPGAVMVKTQPEPDSLERERKAIKSRLEILDMLIELRKVGKSDDYIQGYMDAKGWSL